LVEIKFVNGRENFGGVDVCTVRIDQLVTHLEFRHINACNKSGIFGILGKFSDSAEIKRTI